MDRIVQPEWLDELPANDLRARRSRRDLRRVNAWMGNAGTINRLLSEYWRGEPPQRITDLGAGDGHLVRRLRWPKCERVLIDRQPADSSVTRADVFDWLAGNDSDIIIANLFLHHFDGELPRLLALIAQRCRLFIACEPRRSALALTGVQLLPLIGCGDVTRHDAFISVRAGFAGRELSTLWPAGWELREFPAKLFSHAFVARRA